MNGTMNRWMVGVAAIAAFVLVPASTPHADWTPPESSVTPPAVVTADAFATASYDGGNPLELAAGPDGALYGTTNRFGAHDAGTVFRMEPDGRFTKLHDFSGPDGRAPYYRLTRGAGGLLYGSTAYGGTNDGDDAHSGTLFRVEIDGSITKLHDFTGPDGAQPHGLVAADGALYGLASGGLGFGTLFRLTPDGTFTKVRDFTASERIGTALTLGPDHALYGVAYLGGYQGVIFRLSLDGAYTPLVTVGGSPSAQLAVGPDGALYGTTYSGGTAICGGLGCGSLFRVGVDGSYAELHSFSGPDGSQPLFALTVGADEALYGTTGYGGAAGSGTVFRLGIDGTFATIHDFDGSDGATPWAPMMAGPGGALFGSTQYGGASDTAHGGCTVYGCGTLFRIGTDGAFTKLHVFTGPDGQKPAYGTLVVGTGDRLFGAAASGGASGCGAGCGTLFELDASLDFTLHHVFGAGDGESPSAELVVGPDGAHYGSTFRGGRAGMGTLFRVAADGTFTRLHDFTGPDGAGATSALVLGPDHKLYGTTAYGGDNDAGTLFRLGIDGSFATLHHFALGDGWAKPALVVGPDGAMYGSTLTALFRLRVDGGFTTLHDLSVDDGQLPQAPLVVGPDGGLYGSTNSGGAHDVGTLFRLRTDGTFTKLHDFSQTVDGSGPRSALVVGPDGALYGSTPQGGAAQDLYGSGTLFRIAIDGTFTKLHDFVGSDGGDPEAALVVGGDGALYGSTVHGGSDLGEESGGTLFRLRTDGTFTMLHDFGSPQGGTIPTGLVRGPDGSLYGATSLGGAHDAGTLFRLETSGTFTPIHEFDGTDGRYPLVPMIVGSDGSLYGSTLYGGPRSGGILFKLVLTPPDQDADGVSDDHDSCPGSADGAAVSHDGCSIEQLAPCSGPRSGGTWRNHGQYVSTVTQLAQQFRRAGLIAEAQRRAIVTEAAHSECGK